MPTKYDAPYKALDWTQRDPQQGIMMVKPLGTAELELTPKVSYALSNSLPIWSTQGARSNRSASAASMIEQKAVEAVESESYQDSLRQSTLPSHSGQRNNLTYTNHKIVKWKTGVFNFIHCARMGIIQYL